MPNFQWFSMRSGGGILSHRADLVNSPVDGSVMHHRLVPCPCQRSTPSDSGGHKPLSAGNGRELLPVPSCRWSWDLRAPLGFWESYLGIQREEVRQAPFGNICFLQVLVKGFVSSIALAICHVFLLFLFCFIRAFVLVCRQGLYFY